MAVTQIVRVAVQTTGPPGGAVSLATLQPPGVRQAFQPDMVSRERLAYAGAGPLIIPVWETEVREAEIDPEFRQIDAAWTIRRMVKHRALDERNGKLYIVKAVEV